MQRSMRWLTVMAALGIWAPGMGIAFGATNLLTNGGFETPSLATGGFLALGVGAEPAGFGWTVLAGNVDLANFPNAFVDFDDPEGTQGLDLNGTNRGTISQVFGTTSGRSYRVTFLYADNPIEFGTSTAAVDLVNAAGGQSLLSSSVEHSTSTNGTAAAGDGTADFMLFRARFTATGGSTRLTIASTSPSDSASGGIILDGVSVVEAFAADFDFDDDVDVDDLLIWRGAFAVNNLGDADGDNDSDGADFLIWQRQVGSTSSVPAGGAVPEPSTLGMAAVLIIPLGYRKQRGRKASDSRQALWPPGVRN